MKTTTDYAIRVLTYILGSIFLLSGLTKAVDPQGMLLKIKAYIVALGYIDVINSFHLLSIVFILALFELALATLLLMNLWKRTVFTVVLYTMIVMTIITGYIYLYNPVSDCGCFGEAITLTHVQTLIKNFLLLFCSTYLYLRRPKNNSYSKYKIRVFCLTLLCYVCLFYYSENNVSPITFTPWRVGADIKQAIYDANNKELSAFCVWDKFGNDQTLAIVNEESPLLLLFTSNTMKDTESRGDFQMKSLKELCEHLKVKFFLVTSLPCSSSCGIVPNENLYCDNVQMSSISRWPFCYVLLKNGKIVGKWNQYNSYSKKQIVRAISDRKIQNLSNYPILIFCFLYLLLFLGIKMSIWHH